VQNSHTKQYEKKRGNCMKLRSTTKKAKNIIRSEMLSYYNAKDYGIWAVNGTIPVCFVATNHTSGGNSGSPVIDSNGYLVGLNFDRAWEGTMSDIEFDPKVCRNITLDIRYVLFILDKLAGADNILKEIKIVR
jgi:hypothetical protein